MIVRRSWAIALLALLVLSLAGNLFVAGLLAGGRLAGGEPPLHGSLIDRAASRLSQNLPPEGRQAVRSALDAHKAELLEQVRKLREARRAVSKLIQAPALDKAALEQALARLRDATSATQNAFHQAIVDAAVAMPQDVREGWWPPIMGKL